MDKVIEGKRFEVYEQGEKMVTVSAGYLLISGLN